MFGVKVAVLALCACVIGITSAQDGGDASMQQPMDPSAYVAYESYMGQKILGLYLKIQTAQHMTIAGSTHFSLMLQSMQESQGQGQGSLGGVYDDVVVVDDDDDMTSESDDDDVPVVISNNVVVGVNDADLDDLDDTSSDTSNSEFDEDLSDDDSEVALLELETERRTPVKRDLEEGGAVYLDADGQTMKAKQSLVAAYHLFYATKHWMHRTIFQASEMQQEYWTDRTFQMEASAFGAGLPPQFMQLLYIRTFRTHMQTLKLSQQLQTVSHFIMWLEDEIDVGKALSNSDTTFHAVVLDDQSDDIVQDKMFAFNSFNSFAMIDMQVWYIDLYLQMMLQSLTAQAQQAAPAAGAAPAGSASFLEESMEEKPFLPFALGMGMGLGGGNPQAMQQFIFFMSMYRIMYQMYAAHAGMTSAMAESIAHHNDDTDIEKASTFRQFARQSFGSFGMFLMNMANIDMYLGILEMYSVYGQGGMGGGSPMMAGL